MYVFILKVRLIESFSGPMLGVRKVARGADMRIHVKALGFRTGAMLERHVLRRVQTALSHVAGQLGRVVVRILDANGPRGGLDKTCSIQLAAPGRPVLVVSAAADDYYAAVDLAARRVGRAASRLLQRRPY
jgi:putative sigma-54 modulation protein